MRPATGRYGDLVCGAHYTISGNSIHFVPASGDRIMQTREILSTVAVPFIGQTQSYYGDKMIRYWLDSFKNMCFDFTGGNYRFGIHLF